MMRMRFFGGIRVAASTFLLLCCTASPSSALAFFNTNSPIGTNTNEVMEYDSSMPFIDLFKSSLPFREAVPYLTKGNVTYDRLGWPTSIPPGGQAGTRLINKLPANTIPRGYYTVLYDGQGKIEYGLDATLVESQPGRDVILIDPGKDQEYSVKLEIKATTPGNYIRNIHVVPQGGICASNPFQRVNSAAQCARKDFLDFERHHAKIIFNPDYLKFMRDYKVVRFMNMSGITRNPIRYWADRPLVEQATWGGAEGVRGAPLEVMVELANRLHADPWFTLPHAADNDYVTRFAQYVKANLDPSLRVYLEYSNETWNGIFSQHAYMKQGGKQLNLDPVDHVAGYKYYSLRSVEIFKIFEQVFGGKDRLIRLLAGLTGSLDMTTTMLSFRDAYQNVDAFAVAPYFFGDINTFRRASNVNHIFQAMMDRKSGHSLPRVIEYMRKQGEIARKFGVDLIAYEGGQHLIDDKTKKDDQHPNPLFYKANRHPQMASMYKQMLDGWKQAGGKMFVHFSSPRIYTRFGSKGTKEYITQPDNEAPKHQALTRFIASNPCWWPGCEGSVVSRQQKPRALSTQELARLSGDKAAPLPNTPEEREEPAAEAAAAAARVAAAKAAAAKAAAAKLAEEKAAEAKRAAAERARLAAMNIPQIGVSGDPGFAAPPSVSAIPDVSDSIPNLQPLSAQPNARYQPILVAIRNPPQERFVFGNKAVAFAATNAGNPLNNASTYQLRKVIQGKVEGPRDLAAIWQASWDQQQLYLRIAVADDVLKHDSNFNWDDDNIEVHLDADASQGRQYDGVNDLHLMYRWRDRTLLFGKNSARVPVGHHSENFNGQYVLDLAIPWASLGVQPRIGHRIGLDIHVDDDDDGGARDGKLSWFSTLDEVWRDPSLMGEVVLQ